jgi:hypothetical protein
LVWETVGERQLGKHKRKLENNIKLGVKEIGWEGVVWILAAKGRDHCRALMNTAMKLKVPENAEISVYVCVAGADLMDSRFTPDIHVVRITKQGT